jgi:hypothetical protein
MKKNRILLACFSGVCLILMVLFSPASSKAIPVIQEVLYDGQGTDAIDVFTEIFGAAEMRLDGWSLVGVNGSNGEIYRTVSLEGAVIPDDGILLITTSAAAATLLPYGDFIANVDWQNGPDAVQLRDSEGHILDALQYGNAGVNNAGEGTPAPDVTAGWSLSRDLFGTDTNDNLTDFIPTSAPTPGTGPTSGAEPTPVPEPSTLALVTTSILTLIAFVRKTV